MLDQARQYNPQHTQLNEWLNSVQEAMNATGVNSDFYFQQPY
ncbi:MAG: hypothetical protein R3C26_00040 [Calditrichia bacterium]